MAGSDRSRRCTRDQERTKGEGHEVVAFVAVVSYSYFQENRPAGVYRREFDSHDGAGEWLDLLYEKEIQVRFDPAKPSRSTLLASDLPLPPQHSPESPSYRQRAFSNSFGNTVETGALSSSSLAMLSILGLIICFVLHTMTFVRAPFSVGWRFPLLFGMQIYTMAVFGFAYKLDHSVWDRLTSAVYKQEVAAVTPEGFRATGKLLSSYAVLWLCIFVYRDFILHQNRDIDPLPLLTAFQAVFLFEAYCKTQLSRWRLESSGN